MKAFGIFNLIAWLALILVVRAAASNDSLMCVGVLGGGALVVIDVIWLIALAIISESPGRADVTLVEYLKKARARGIDDDEIECRLLQNGWSASAIRRAREVPGS